MFLFVIGGNMTLQERVAMWQAWNELNIIRARDGVPRDYNGHKTSVCEKYFSQVVDDLKHCLGKDANPWPPKE